MKKFILGIAIGVMAIAGVSYAATILRPDAGGTGLGSITPGFVLTGNSATTTFAKQLVAGTNVTIASTSNSITISATGGVAGDWATTSSDYWQTQRNFYSTTSSDYWLTLNQGKAFSTTSAIYFTHSSTTIPKTYANNVFTNDNTFASTTITNIQIPGVYNATQDPSGFYDKDDSLSFNNGTRVFSITGTHTFYLNGVMFTKPSATITIANTVGTHYIYYDATGTLVESMTPPPFYLALLATIYWDGTRGLVGEERHGITMDWKTHQYLHTTVGARYGNGYTGTFTNTTLSLTAGSTWDEDIQHNTLATTTNIILYKNGTSDFVSDAPGALPYKTNTGVIQYQNGNVLANVGNSRFVASWVFATNGTTTPIYTIVGQREDLTIANARDNNTPDAITFGQLPTSEFKLLYRVIYQNSGGTPTYVETQDYRNTSVLPGSSFTATAHNTLTNLHWSEAGHSFDTNLDLGAYNLYTTGLVQATSSLFTNATTSNLTVSGATGLAMTSGKVGIATTSTFSKFSIKGDGTTTGYGFQYTNSSNAPQVSMQDKGTLTLGNPAISGISTYERFNLNDEAGNLSDYSFKVAGGGHSIWSYGSSNGTLASPSTSTANALVGEITGYSYTAGGYKASANIQYGLDGTPTLTSSAGKIIFQTTSNNAITASTKMTLDNSGNLTVNTATATTTLSGGLSVVGASGLNVLQNGNVGIGTASPARQLDVGTIRNRQYTEYMNGAVINAYQGAYNQLINVTPANTDYANYIVNGAMRFYINSSTREAGRFASNGFFALGDQYASPTERLTVYGGHLGFRTITKPTAPSGVAQGSGGSLPIRTDLKYILTYVTASGETNVSTASGSITTILNDSVIVTIATSTHSEVTSRKLYRNIAAYPTQFYLVDTIANNTAGTYTDIKADAGLGTAESSSRDNTTAGIFYLDGAISGGVTGNSVWWGLNSLPLAHTSVGLTYIGASAGSNITTAGYSTSVGQTSQTNNKTGSINTSVGAYAAYGSGATDLGAYNTIVGGFAGYNFGASSAYNNALGAQALFNTTSEINNAIGMNAGYYNTTGTYNLFIGHSSGAQGTNNITTDSFMGLIGWQAGKDTPAILSNGWTIGNNSRVGISNALTIGTDATYPLKVGIGTSTPGANLHIQATDSTVVAKEFLRLDNGSTNTTNNGTSIGFYQLGTQQGRIASHYTAATSWYMSMGVGANEHLVIGNTGKIGIGNTNPSVTLDIVEGGSSDGIRLGQDRTNYYKIGRNTSTGLLDITGTQADPYSGLAVNSRKVITRWKDKMSIPSATSTDEGLKFGSCLESGGNSVTIDKIDTLIASTTGNPTYSTSKMGIAWNLNIASNTGTTSPMTAFTSVSYSQGTTSIQSFTPNGTVTIPSGYCYWFSPTLASSTQIQQFYLNIYGYEN